MRDASPGGMGAATMRPRRSVMEVWGKAVMQSLRVLVHGADPVSYVPYGSD